jgi:hypothetical protein
MPRINRRNRTRSSEQRLEIGDRRWFMLMYGSDLGFNRRGGALDFQGGRQLRALWQRNRNALMEFCGPGERPTAYYHFKLGVAISEIPIRWLDQIEFLDLRQMLDADESRDVELIYPMLSTFKPDPSVFDAGPVAASPEFCSILEHRFAVAAGWHNRRGREQLAAHYHRLALHAAGSRRGLLLDTLQTSAEQHDQPNPGV